jgi:hypothetical protein
MERLGLAGFLRRHEEVQQQRNDLLRQLDAVFEAQRPPSDAAVPAASLSETTGGDGRRARRRRRWARWKWPVEDLVADTAWWDRWLQDLYELLGRDLRGEPDRLGSPGKPVVDRRGYGDLLTYLFPPAGGVTWRSPDYPRVASEQARHGAQDGTSLSVRAQSWEPVLPHVATALRALEETSVAGTDPSCAWRPRRGSPGPGSWSWGTSWASTRRQGSRARSTD